MNENFDNTPEIPEVPDVPETTEIPEEAENGEITTSEKAGKRFLREVYDWLETLAFAFAFVLIVFTSIMRVVTVDGRSMHYTLDHGDKLVISDVLYEPKYGDIIVVSNERTGKPIIKRVIATEGQTVDFDFESWTVTVDGVPLDEPYINDEEKEFGIPLVEGYEYNYPFTVSEGCVFAMGDNRNHSSDSRHYGEFREEDIMGRVILRLFPFDAFGKIGVASDERIAEIKAKSLY